MFHIPAHKNTQNPPAQVKPKAQTSELTADPKPFGSNLANGDQERQRQARLKRMYSDEFRTWKRGATFRIMETMSGDPFVVGQEVQMVGNSGGLASFYAATQSPHDEGHPMIYWEVERINQPGEKA